VSVRCSFELKPLMMLHTDWVS